MQRNDLFPPLELQLFADAAGDTGAAGATGDTAAAAVPQNTQSETPLPEVKYGIQAEETAPAQPQEVPPDRNAAFEKLIKGEYKDLYDAKVQDTVKRRLKGTQETADRYRQLAPTLEMLGKKYGIRPDRNGAYDIAALNKAIEDDDSYYEKEAMEQGLSVEQFKQIRKMERENADLRRQMQEQRTRENASRLYAQWMEQAGQVKTVYPSFQLEAELKNAKFADLLKAGIDVRSAYEVLHKDEIIPAAMQLTAKTVEQKLTNKIAAAGQRPVENGNSGQSAAIVKSDVSQLTKADRREIIRRVQRGETIRF